MFLLSYSLIAQNYQPFKAGIRYQFINSTKDTITTLKIDSVATINRNTIFYFNSTFKPLPKWEYSKDSNNVFGYFMIKKQDGVYIFVIVEKDSFLIKTQIPQNSKWTFSKSSNIEATYVLKKDTIILGIKDSVMVFQLSDKSIIELSKNFGFIKSLNFNTYFNRANMYPLVLDAIPEYNMGNYLGNPFVYYDFEVGDVFVYSSQVSSPTISRMVKKEILDRKDYNKDSIVYIIKRTKFEILQNPMVIERVKYTQDTIKETILADLPIQSYDQIFPFSIPVDFYGWEEGLNTYSGINLLSNDYVLRDGFAFRAVITKDETEKFKMEISPSYLFSSGYKITYKEGLGWTDLYHFNEFQNSYKYASLMCYIKKNESYGDCSEVDKILSTSEKEFEGSISIFPNPATDIITIKMPNKYLEENTFTIYNSLGITVYTKKLENNRDSYSINILDFLPGIYNSELGGRKVFRKSFVKL